MLIAFNGHHYCSFRHRMPLSRVQAIRVNGDLNIFHLEHRHKNVEEYPQPSRIAVSRAVPTLPCTVNPNQCCSYITQPNAPYTLPLPVPLAAGQMIALEGEVWPQANGSNAPYILPLPVPLAAGQMIALEGEVWPQANGLHSTVTTTAPSRTACRCRASKQSA
ncbi:hypothetical protein B566_EDAN014465 [Ephemera danica]|nr:hypothetical protein B566_EDAN014465 [Ephemera danica]